MVALSTFLAIYLFGGLTFLPLLLVGALYIFATNDNASPNPKAVFPEEPYKDVDPEQGKKGWIRLTNQQDGVQGGRLMSGLQSYVNSSSSNGAQVKKPKGVAYGLLKHGTLFVYESDKLQDCKLIIPVHDFTVSIYPEDKREHEVFNRSAAIRLRPKRSQQIKRSSDPVNGLKKSSTESSLLDSSSECCCSLDQDIYLTCARSIDKEDWYFALIVASGFMADTPELGHVETVDGTRFDEDAMQRLIQTVHSDPAQREMQWLNAIMGRIFLGMYKTDKIHQFFKDKITKKARKVKRPQFLDEITVHQVHVGQTVPHLTQFKLLSLGLDGQLTAEAHVDYQGGLCVEIGTGLIWPGYSSRMKPIRLLLSVTLKRFVGKFQFKIKAPPTNRYWIGFYDPPEMDLVIKPLVSDKHIKLNVVTNAIETKIREVISETLVLPNMDDFVFCDMGGKGGIFGDKVPRSTSSPPLRMDTAPQLHTATTTTQAPDAEDHDHDAASSSSSSLPDIDVDVSKSAPELLHRAGPPPAADTVSIASTDTIMSTSSSIRWPIRRKKKAASDTASIASSNDDVSSRKNSGFLSKISTLSNTINSDEGGGGRPRASSFYQKAETMIKASIHKDEDPTPTPQPREDNPRIAKRPPPPPPKPVRQQPQQPMQQPQPSVKQHEESQKPPLPPRVHSEQEQSEQQLQAPPPPPPRRKVEDKPPLPPRSSPRLESSSPPPPPPPLSSSSSSPPPQSPPSPKQQK